MGDAITLFPRSTFGRYWTAAASSSIGTAVTAVAKPVLVVQCFARHRSRSVS
jgi:hypothetical protein